jgi:chromosome segregation ATPase
VPREKIQRRIDKLTAARKSAEEKATALAAEAEEAKAKVAEYEAQLNEAARPVLSPTADNPLADVDTQDALDAKIKSAQEVRRWALRNTDGATVKRPDGTEVYLDSDQVKGLPH